MLFKYISFILAISFIVSCSESENLKTESTVQNTAIADEKEPSIAEDISAEKFKTLMGKEEAIILDVRTAEECADGMIDDAINIDFFSKDFENQIKTLDKSKTILVYCKAGGRSAKTKSKLEALEFETVYNLLGGYSNWPYKN